MPAYAQAALIPRAVASVRAQTTDDWELIVVDDGSPDDVRGVLPLDRRIRLVERSCNGGLGCALNDGLEVARAAVIAYLPCDDVLAADHLSSLLDALRAEPRAAAAVATLAGPPDPVLQLVQVAHRRTASRWTERAQLESDDLELLFWRRLRAEGTFVATGRATCVWTAHPWQRHRAFRESADGGLNVVRSRYGIREPLRFHSSETGLVDEVTRFAADRARPPTPAASDGLRIVLAGELAFNADRVLALEERGHRLYGLWIDDPLGFNTVGPLPSATWRTSMPALRSRSSAAFGPTSSTRC